MKSFPRLLAPLLVAAGLFGCSKPQGPDVIVLHSGRFRGNVYPLSLQDMSPLQHYQYLAGYIREVRKEAEATGAKVVVIDLGDSLAGSFASHVTGSMNMAAFFNAAGYDAVVLSNLDADVPQAAISALKARVLSPFSGANGEMPFPGTVPAAKFDLHGLPLRLIANFYGDVDPKDHPGRFPPRYGSLGGDVRPVRDYTKALAGLGARPADGLTLFTWMKFEPSEKAPDAFLASLRREGIDAIAAHRIYGGNEVEAWQPSGFVDWQPPVSLNILRRNGGFVLARMDLARTHDGWKVLRHELVPMTANRADADAAVSKEIEKFSSQIRDADRVVAQLPQAVEEDAILALYMKALATLPDTDVVAYSSQSIRSDWPAGELRASRVFESLPWTTGLASLTADRAALEGFAKEEGLVLNFTAAAPESGPVRVTTSRFFADLLSRKLNLPPEAVSDLPQRSEFDFFAAYLAAHPQTAAAP